MAVKRSIRMCLHCRKREEKQELLRFVLRDGTLTSDPTQNAPGRGVYLHRRCRAMPPDVGRWRHSLRIKEGAKASLSQAVITATDVRNAIEDSYQPGEEKF